MGQAAGLREACRQAGVERLALSSTAAVYGEPEGVPIREDHPLRPTNPCGATKRAIEEMLGHFEAAAGLRWVSLRYFNAAGACPDGAQGEHHDPETHLVPLALAAAGGHREPLTVFGRDYETRDGTCVRHYIHVFDLAQAHVQALEWMEAHAGQRLICNLGTEQGKSVQEMLDAIGRVTGREVPYEDGPRRAGDPAVLVASNERAEEEPGWETTRSDIDTIVRDAWAWHSRHPEGYGD